MEKKVSLTSHGWIEKQKLQTEKNGVYGENNLPHSHVKKSFVTDEVIKFWDIPDQSQNLITSSVSKDFFFFFRHYAMTVRQVVFCL